MCTFLPIASRIVSRFEKFRDHFNAFLHLSSPSLSCSLLLLSLLHLYTFLHLSSLSPLFPPSLPLSLPLFTPLSPLFFPPVFLPLFPPLLSSPLFSPLLSPSLSSLLPPSLLSPLLPSLSSQGSECGPILGEGGLSGVPPNGANVSHHRRRHGGPDFSHCQLQPEEPLQSAHAVTGAGSTGA